MMSYAQAKTYLEHEQQPRKVMPWCSARPEDIANWLACLNLQDREKPGHKVEVDEEYEDADGNVYNRKTYEDLRRQGLI